MENKNISSQSHLCVTPLLSLHQAHAAKMVDFAGFLMPIQYEGIVAEHIHTRNHCSLFDVSHMGQAWVLGDSLEETALALQSVLPADLLSLPEGKMCYTTLLNEQGGIIDDLIITRLPNEAERYTEKEQSAYFHMVVNASRKEVDYAYFSDIFKQFCGQANLRILDKSALIALQGPKTLEILKQLNPLVAEMPFMTARYLKLGEIDCWVSRCGYTGESGVEIATDAKDINDLCERLLAFEGVKMAGLGARDSLRLEAGLPLYGNDMDETFTPVEANLSFVLNKKRLAQVDFAGASTVIEQLSQGVKRLRVGLEIAGRAPIRQGAAIMLGDKEVGKVTSGCFSPTLQKPIAFAVIDTDCLSSADLVAVVRNKSVPIKVGELVFVPTRYK